MFLIFTNSILKFSKYIYRPDKIKFLFCIFVFLFKSTKYNIYLSRKGWTRRRKSTSTLYQHFIIIYFTTYPILRNGCKRHSSRMALSFFSCLKYGRSKFRIANVSSLITFCVTSWQRYQPQFVCTRPRAHCYSEGVCRILPTLYLVPVNYSPTLHPRRELLHEATVAGQSVCKHDWQLATKYAPSLGSCSFVLHDMSLYCKVDRHLWIVLYLLSLTRRAEYMVSLAIVKYLYLYFLTDLKHFMASGNRWKYVYKPSVSRRCRLHVSTIEVTKTKSDTWNSV